MSTGETVGVVLVGTLLLVGTGAAVYLIINGRPQATPARPPAQVGTPLGPPTPGVRAAVPQAGIGGVGGSASTVFRLASPIVAGFFAGGPAGGAAAFAGTVL